jgi:site-specific DNA-methyltransferase (adenine-specific)
VAKKIAGQLGKIHQGDCISGMQQMPDESVDLAFADPPFNIGYEYDEYDDRLDTEKYLEWSKQWISEVYRVLAPDGAFWLAIGDEYAAELKVESQKIGFHPRNWVVWYYTFGVHCKNKFTRSHAHLFYFVKDSDVFTFNRDSIAVPSARQLVYGDKRANPKGRSPDDTWILRPQDCEPGFEADEDTWYFPRVAGTFKERAGFHGCQMPEQLLGRIIKACSNEDDVVLDPFSGSSTTLTVAKKLGRDFLGFELSEEYAKLGTDRLAAASVGDRLEGAEEPKVSAPATNSKQARRKRSKNQLSLGFDS